MGLPTHRPREGQRARTPSRADYLEVFLAMRDAATGGDVQAGKLVIDRLCETDAQKLEIDHSGEIKGSNGPTLPATDDLLKGIEKLRDLANEHFGDK
jgi:hypothetical protein